MNPTTDALIQQARAVAREAQRVRDQAAAVLALSRATRDNYRECRDRRAADR